MELKPNQSALILTTEEDGEITVIVASGDQSKKFYKLVGSIIPDYADWKQWLKVNGSGLRI